MVAAALLFFSALRPQIETLQPLDASACAMPSPIPPLPPVMTAVRPERSKMLIGCFHLFGYDVRHADVPCQPWTRRPKNQIWRPRHPIDAPRERKRADTTHEETMQFKHVTLDFDGPVAVLKLDHQEVMNAVSMDMLGGLAEALDAIDEKKGRGALPRHDRRGTRVLHRRQSAGPQQPEAGQEQCRRLAGGRLPSVPAPLTQAALPARDRR